MAAEINTVVFDIGNVLVRWEIAKGLPNRTPAEIQSFLTEFDFHEFNMRLDAGMPAEEVFLEVEQNSPHWLPYLQEYLQHFSNAVSQPEPGMETLIEDLKANKVKTYGLTNWAADRWDIALTNIPALSLLDGIVISGFEGVTKPDPRIYQILINRFNIDTPHTLFIDDNAPNCAAAAQLGFQTFQFHPGDASKLADLVSGLNYGWAH